jgi:hypothetical protein
LPGQQTNFALQVLSAAAAKKIPAVVVLISGGILSIDALVAPAPAIVDAFNPAQAGPKALADTLFGVENRWGKLPVTIYPADYAGTVLFPLYQPSRPSNHHLPGRLCWYGALPSLAAKPP